MQPPTSLSIGEATAADLPQLLDLFTHLHPDDPPLPIDACVTALWQTILANENLHYVVARHDDRLVATCTLTIIPNLTRGARPYGLIENVVTHPDFRRRGISTAVLHHAVQIARSKDCFKVMIPVGRQPESLLHFYQKAGFGRGDKAVAFIIRPDAFPIL